MSDRAGSDVVLGRLLRQFSVETDRFAEVFSELHGMHRTDLNALVVIIDADHRNAPISPGLLAKALHLSASATTAVLDRLEAAGHIVRDRDPGDRRRVGLRPARQATELGGRFFRPLATELARTWTVFSAEERATIERFLTLTIDTTVQVRGTMADPATA